MVEIKGGFRNLMAKVIFITSPSHPLEAYRGSDENLDQLTRRITEIVKFPIGTDVHGTEVKGNTNLDPKDKDNMDDK